MIVFHVHVVVVLLDRMLSGRGYDRCGIPSVAQRLMHVCRKSCNRRSSIAAFSIARSNAVRMLFTGRPLRTRDRKQVKSTRAAQSGSVDAQHTRDRNYRLFLRIACRSSNNAQAFRIEIASCRNAATLPTGWHVQWQKKQRRDLPNGHWASRSSFQRRIILPTSICRRGVTDSDNIDTEKDRNIRRALTPLRIP